MELAGQLLASVPLLDEAVQLSGPANKVAEALAVELEGAVAAGDCLVEVAAPGGHEPEVDPGLGDSHGGVRGSVAPCVLGLPAAAGAG